MAMARTPSWQSTSPVAISVTSRQGLAARSAPVFDLLGLKPALKVDKPSSNHEGDDISVEAIADSNPDWIFVMDRDGAINADKPDYKEASSVIADSEALKNVTAVKDKHLVYAPKDTYINESIITYTTILNNIADAFNNQQ
nr:ABC transporter substrate-binding protein [Corynebacterium falsenii]